MAGLIAPFGRRQIDRTGSTDLRAFVGQFLDLIETIAVQEPDAMAREFQQQIDQFRAQLAQSEDSQAVTRTGGAFIEAGRHYIAARRAQYAEREVGLRGMIQVLTDGLTTVATEAGSFTAELTSASERVSGLARVDDIRVLKQRLSHEVGQIKRVVAEKQQRDQSLHVRLTQRVEALESSLLQTRVAAMFDPLTKVANRGHFDAALEDWVGRHRDANKTFVLAMIDIDNFKSINDTHGHPTGDRVLHGIAQTLTRLVRPCDVVARYGGDEFALLLANMTLEQAEKRAPEIVAHLSQADFAPENSGAAPLHATISCGLAQIGRHDTGDSLKQRADEALYAAKGQGRNGAAAKRTPLWPGR
jgi:diguanylate cyclase